jgi:hypothetical protein
MKRREREKEKEISEAQQIKARCVSFECDIVIGVSEMFISLGCPVTSSLNCCSVCRFCALCMGEGLN